MKPETLKRLAQRTDHLVGRSTVTEMDLGLYYADMLSEAERKELEQRLWLEDPVAAAAVFVENAMPGPVTEARSLWVYCRGAWRQVVAILEPQKRKWAVTRRRVMDEAPRGEATLEPRLVPILTLGESATAARSQQIASVKVGLPDAPGATVTVQVVPDHKGSGESEWKLVCQISSDTAPKGLSFKLSVGGEDQGFIKPLTQGKHPTEVLFTPPDPEAAVSLEFMWLDADKRTVSHLCTLPIAAVDSLED